MRTRRFDLTKNFFYLRAIGSQLLAPDCARSIGARGLVFMPCICTARIFLRFSVRNWQPLRIYWMRLSPIQFGSRKKARNTMNHPNFSRRFAQIRLVASIAVALLGSSITSGSVSGQSPTVVESVRSIKRVHGNPLPAGEIKSSRPLDFKTACQKAQKEGKPLLVLVTAQWCAPCQIMKKKTVPQLLRNNAFRGFHFATVDYDREQIMARKLIGSRGIPQLIMFKKKDGRWVGRRMSGVHSTSEVEAFIAQSP